MARKLNYPFTAAQIADLRAGERVTVSGLVLTGRDCVHRYLAEGGAAPRDLTDAALYHCGPVIARQDGKWLVRAAGPTTSLRQEPYLARLLERHRVRVLIGKGGMGEQTREALRRHGCVYLQAVGGAAGVLAACVENVGAVYFLKEFGPAEAMWELTVKDLEAIVTMDAAGRSLHERVRAASKRALRRILAGRRGRRAAS